MKTRSLIVFIAIFILLAGCYHLLFNTVLAQPNEIDSTLDVMANGFSFTGGSSQLKLIIIILKLLKIAFLVLHFLTGYLFLKNKKSGRYLANMLGIFYFFRIFYYFALLGSIYREMAIIVSLILPLGLLFFVNSKLIRKHVPCGKSLKVVWITLVLLLFFLVSAYAYLIHTINKNSPKFDDSSYIPMSFDNNEETISFDYPPYFSIDFPKDNFKLGRLSLNSDYPLISYQLPKDSLVILFNNESTLKAMYDNFIPNSLYSEVEVTKKIVRERYGLIYQIFNSRIINNFKLIKPFRNYMHNNLEVINYNREKFDYYFYYTNNSNSMEILFIPLNSENNSKPLEYNYDLVEKISGSVRPIVNEVNAEYYFNIGLKMFNEKRYNRAILSFISALSLDSNNPNYNLIIAKSLINNSNNNYSQVQNKWYNAKEFLNLELLHNPNNIEAQELLEVANERYEELIND